MKNIKLFDIYSSYLFEKLYNSFPKCITIDTVDDEIEKIDENFKDELKKLNLNISQEEKNIIFSETILWFTNNGFIDFTDSYPETKRPVESMSYQYFMCIILTIKGLNLLTSPKPKSISKHKRLGEEVTQMVKQGSLIEAGKLITENMFDFIITKGVS